MSKCMNCIYLIYCKKSRDCTLLVKWRDWREAENKHANSVLDRWMNENKTRN